MARVQVILLQTPASVLHHPHRILQRRRCNQAQWELAERLKEEYLNFDESEVGEWWGEGGEKDYWQTLGHGSEREGATAEFGNDDFANTNDDGGPFAVSPTPVLAELPDKLERLSDGLEERWVRCLLSSPLLSPCPSSLLISFCPPISVPFCFVLSSFPLLISTFSFFHLSPPLLHALSLFLLGLHP